MGAFKAANYRSAEQYLEVAKAIHIARGGEWTAQLAQARRLAIRSCKRHLGSPKQAGGLVLLELGKLVHLAEPLAEEGPTWTLLISWWLLREIEASNTRRSHISINTQDTKVTWRLPSSRPGRAGSFSRTPLRMCILQAGGVSLPSHGGTPFLL